MAETIPPPTDADRDFGTRLDEAYKNTTYKDGIRAGLIRLLAEQIRLREQAEAALLDRNIEIDALWKGDDDKHCADMDSSEQCTERYMLMRQRAEQAEARVRELEAVREWQPISTAPIGKFVQVWAPHYQAPVTATYTGLGHSGWCVNGEDVFSDEIPTHWMPLPAPPKEDADGR